MTYNTGETSEELKAQYNPEGSELRKVQLRLLDMLLYIDKVCKEIGVDYRLDGGNVIGAVRHEGFIPWDDDVDIVVENKKEYHRLCNYLLSHPHPQYVLQNEKTDKRYFRYWSVLRDTHSEYIHKLKKADKLDRVMKYRGLQIDIFPYEPGIIPLLNTISGYLYRIEKRMLLKNKLFGHWMHLFQKHLIHPLFNGISRLIGNKNMYMHSYGTGFSFRFPKNVVLPHKPMHFEGYQFPGPANPDLYLKEIYGDFMKLPPKEKRQQHNVFYNLW